MSRKKEATAKQTTRQLIGIDEITDSGLKTSHGRLIFFAIKPTNLSVQPPEAVSNRIYALMTVLKGQAEIEMLALNSKESFEDNKRHYRQRAAEEDLPVISRLLQASKNVRGAMLFNILSYMSDRLLTIGNTTAALDELYVWLSDNVSVGTTIIEYIRNTLKRVRKKESNLIMASQNLEDFDREGIRELTKPLFAIPPHQFIFNCGSIDKRFYMDLLQLEEAEYNLIRFPQRGVCLFKCGNERYLLEVHAPAYKEALFGTAGGR